MNGVVGGGKIVVFGKSWLLIFFCLSGYFFEYGEWDIKLCVGIWIGCVDCLCVGLIILWKIGVMYLLFVFFDLKLEL